MEGEREWIEPPRLRAIYSAMMLGLRDYVVKNRFPGVVLGMSGGIDSALTAAVAVDALGAERVRGVRLPSRFTGQESQDDAAESARLLGMRLDTLEIGSTVTAAEGALAEAFGGRPRDVARRTCRRASAACCSWGCPTSSGRCWSRPATSRRCPSVTPRSTATCVAATRCSRTSTRRRSTRFPVGETKTGPTAALGPAGRVIPESSITKAPTAELRPNQTDQDSLPAYDVLDAILNGLVEEELSVDEIVSRGFPRETVVRIQHLLYTAEYKRRQAPPA